MKYMELYLSDNLNLEIEQIRRKTGSPDTAHVMRIAIAMLKLALEHDGDGDGILIQPASGVGEAIKVNLRKPA